MEGNQGETQLFLLRLWLEELPQTGCEQSGVDNGASAAWRGKVQHVVRGEAHAFTGWDMLIYCLEAMLTRDLDEAAKARANRAERQQT